MDGHHRHLLPHPVWERQGDRPASEYIILIFVYTLVQYFSHFLPKSWFSNLKLFYPLVLFDTCVVSFGMYLSEKMTTDFYLVFFLIIIFASISRNFKLLMIIWGDHGIPLRGPPLFVGVFDIARIAAAISFGFPSSSS